MGLVEIKRQPWFPLRENVAANDTYLTTFEHDNSAYTSIMKEDYQSTEWQDDMLTSYRTIQYWEELNVTPITNRNYHTISSRILTSQTCFTENQWSSMSLPRKTCLTDSTLLSWTVSRRMVSFASLYPQSLK